MFTSSLILMILTLFSRILGLIRTNCITFFFGASMESDAFFAAYKIANFFRQLLGEGALGSCFIPNYNEKLENKGKKEANQLIFSILNLVAIFTIFISILTITFSDQIINLIAPGYNDETKILSSSLLNITAFYLVCIGIAGMIGSILNNEKKFFVPALIPIVFNLGVIFWAVFFSDQLGIFSLAYGVITGGVLQILVLLPQFIKIYKTISFKIDLKDRYLKNTFYMMIPMLVGIFARQINSIVDQIFGSMLRIGSVSALNYSTFLYNLPIGIFGISLATVIYPYLSKAAIQNDTETMSLQIGKGINFLLFFVIPSMAVLIFKAYDVVDIVFNRGEFDQTAMNITSESLAAYSIGVFFYTGVHLMSRSFYSMKNSKIPVFFSIIAIIVNITLNILLIETFEHVGLALATAIASGVNFSLLYFYFNKRYIRLKIMRNVRFMIITIFFATIAYYFSNNFENSILSIVSFGILYLIFWILPYMKKGAGIFE